MLRRCTTGLVMALLLAVIALSTPQLVQVTDMEDAPTMARTMPELPAPAVPPAAAAIAAVQELGAVLAECAAVTSVTEGVALRSAATGAAGVDSTQSHWARRILTRHNEKAAWL